MGIRKGEVGVDRTVTAEHVAGAACGRTATLEKMRCRSGRGRIIRIGALGLAGQQGSVQSVRGCGETRV